MIFAKEGYSNIAAATAIAVVLCIIASLIGRTGGYILYGIAVIFEAFILFFFRDPDRSPPNDDDLILAPADGKVVLIQETGEPHYIQGKAIQISIFLSLFDVHVNRVPSNGTVEYLKYHPGAYLMAWKEEASTLNERSDIGVKHPGGVKIFFRQITGFLARRIVYHLEEGDPVQAGDRFGMMKFGSRMDILVPSDAEIKVRKGDRTTGGETILARIDN
jgi:phosphatidylserine decarboxylase